jgi:hypothetical protein
MDGFTLFFIVMIFISAAAYKHDIEIYREVFEHPCEYAEAKGCCLISAESDDGYYLPKDIYINSSLG